SPDSPACLRNRFRAATPERIAATSRARSFSSLTSGSAYSNAVTVASATASLTAPAASVTVSLVPRFRPNMTHLQQMYRLQTLLNGKARSKLPTRKDPANSGRQRGGGAWHAHGGPQRTRSRAGCRSFVSYFAAADLVRVGVAFATRAATSAAAPKRRIRPPNAIAHRANHAQPSERPAITSVSQWTSSRTRLAATPTATP